MVVMINGKKRGLIEVLSNTNQEKLIEIIDKEKNIFVSKKDKFKKIIFVKNKIINFVKWKSLFTFLYFFLGFVAVLTSLFTKRMPFSQNMQLI